MHGTIKRLLPDRRFGFIAAGNQEYFFHQSALQGAAFEELAEGVRVDFEESRDAPGDARSEGPRAVSVRLVEDALPAVDGEVLPPGKSG